jgi:hypothetical protein
MDEPELPDLALVLCIRVDDTLGIRCNAAISTLGITFVDRVLCVQARCAGGHELNGTISELFEPLDLARAALYWLDANDFRTLQAICVKYAEYMRAHRGNPDQVIAASYEFEVVEFAAAHPVVSEAVWICVMTHWDEIEKPRHPDRSNLTGLCPDYFNPLDWV